MDSDEHEERKLKSQLKTKRANLENNQNILRQKSQPPQEKPKKIHCTIKAAKKLDNKEFGGLSDPYVVMRIGTQKAQTQVVWDTLNPEWDETFTFTYLPDKHRFLTFELYDHNKIAPTPLGHLEFNLRELEPDETLERWEKLENSKKGQLGFKLLYIATDEDENGEASPPSPKKLTAGGAEELDRWGLPKARSDEYKAMEIDPADCPPDPWSVLEANEKYLEKDEVDRRRQRLSDVYGDWDMDGSGRVEFDEIQQIIVSYRHPNVDPEKQWKVLRKWGVLVTCKQIPKGGYDRETLLPFIIRLTNEYTAGEFDRFLLHILETIQVMLDITETGRRTKGTWRLFKAWDTNCNLALDTNQLEHIIGATEYGKANQEKLNELLQNIRDQYPDRQGIDDVGIKEFHEFMNAFLDRCSEMEMNYVFGQIRTAMREELLEDTHIVTRLLNHNKKLYGGDIPAEGQVTEDDRLTQKLMWQLQSDSRHAFDSLSLEHIDEALSKKNPGSCYTVVATPICLIFGIKPAQNPKTGILDFWEGLKEFIVDDPHRFLHFLQNFEISHLPYELVQKIMVFHFMEESDPQFLLSKSKFLSCLCVWCEASVHLCCKINDWEYPPPPSEDDELQQPTFQGSGVSDKLAGVPGFLRDYPSDVSIGIDKPPKTLAYKLPRWGYVKDWTGDKESLKVQCDPLTGKQQVVEERSKTVYRGPPPRERKGNRPTGTVPESGALNRLTQLLQKRAAEFSEGRVPVKSHKQDTETVQQDQEYVISYLGTKRPVQVKAGWTHDKVERKIRVTFTDSLSETARFRLLDDDDMAATPIDKMQNDRCYVLELRKRT